MRHKLALLTGQIEMPDNGGPPMPRTVEPGTENPLPYVYACDSSVSIQTVHALCISSLAVVSCHAVDFNSLLMA